PDLRYQVRLIEPAPQRRALPARAPAQPPARHPHPAGGCAVIGPPGGHVAEETVRVAAPDGAVRSVIGMSGREYRSRDGMYEMSASDARALVKAGGFKPTLGSPARGGYPCP